MNLFALIVLMGFIGQCLALKCYSGYEPQLTIQNVQDTYCVQGRVKCSGAIGHCTSAEIAAGAYTWYFTSSNSQVQGYVNSTVCTTDLCNAPSSLPDGFWCYFGSGQSTLDMVPSYVTKASGDKCYSYGVACSGNNPLCTADENKNEANRYMSGYFSDYSCQSLMLSGYMNASCCTADYCNGSPGLKCNAGQSTVGGSPLASIQAPFDNDRHACYGYFKDCDGVECPLGSTRSYFGYTNKSECTNLQQSYKGVSCCTWDNCNKAMGCYVGGSPKSARQQILLVDGAPLSCVTNVKNCSIEPDGCTLEQISGGKREYSYSYTSESNCYVKSCCVGAYCNAPATLVCHNTSNVFNITQPDSRKSVPMATYADNCARFSYECSNPLSKAYCNQSEVSRAAVKTVYGSATDADCEKARKDYLNILDPYCCKSNLCNVKVQVTASLTCYTGQYVIGAGVPRTNLIRLPSSNLYSCYTRQYKCTQAGVGGCSLSDVSKNVSRVEYGVSDACTQPDLSCCTYSKCNLLPGTLLIDAVPSPVAVASSGTKPPKATSKPVTSTRVSGENCIQTSLLLALFVTILQMLSPF